MDLTTPVSGLAKVGKTTAARLKNLGIVTARDLLFHFPFRYEDYSLIKPIAQLVVGEPVTIRAKIQLIASRRSRRKRMMLTEALVADDSGSLKVVWFNQPFISKMLEAGDEIFLSGELDESRVQMVSPEFERVREQRSEIERSGDRVNQLTTHTARIIPVYHSTDGVTQKQLRYLMSQVLPLARQMEEFLPFEIIDKYKFPILSQALQQIHFPNNAEKSSVATRRLKFDELFLIQLAIQRLRQDIRETRAFKLAFLEKQTKEFVASLPFTLTDAQKKCAWEIIRDLEKDAPMNRLLEGDVGSGKTVVVAVAMINVILNGYKVVLMAPTEILAEQHFRGLAKLFAKNKFSVALFTGSKRQLGEDSIGKAELLDKLAAGEVDVVIGTHAVIQDTVKVKDLGLVVVDEQHRFGVGQRKALLERDKDKNLAPHFLSMTATPIPRSLVLTLYGDLDLSIINEMPKGRKPIITKVIYEQDREKSYSFIREQIKEGRQVFVICPLIDPSDKLGVKSVKQEHEKLDKVIFPELSVGLMHGRLKPKDKEQVMQDFYARKYQILVSTSVIEVGIDVPNATIIMIEGADRFGLAQLHQFRGRVGRGEYQSYCFLFSENGAPATQKRLRFMETCHNGFQLAEKDLELRGPGEVYGTRQSGLPDLKIAELTDVETIQNAQIEAKALVESGQMSAELAAALRRVSVSMHFE